MQMRYFQPLWDIVNRYEEWVGLLEIQSKNEELSLFQELTLEQVQPYLGTYEETVKECEALQYLANLRLGFTHGKGITKPETTVVTRAFHRFLSYLEEIHSVNRAMKEAECNRITYKEMKCCYYYLFRFTLPAWVEKLPAYIPSFEEKHSQTRLHLKTKKLSRLTSKERKRGADNPHR